jgi:hypothetical protein
MGATARCECRYRGKSSVGTARLESDDLIFRGDFRVAIPFKSISSVKSSGGELVITFDGKKAAFVLGDKAAKWAAKIATPPSLLQKLGVKPDSAIAVSALDDSDFVASLESHAAEVARRLRKNRDIIFFGADKKSDLARLERLKTYLKPNGAIWVIRPKGVDRITESDVLLGGKKAGLVDVKVARFSDTHTAEKFVIPRARR